MKHIRTNTWHRSAPREFDWDDEGGALPTFFGALVVFILLAVAALTFFAR